MNAKEFNLKIHKLAKDLTEDQVSAFTRKIALEVLAGVVGMTPVDTGRARGNWQTTIGTKPASSVLGWQGRDPVSDGISVLQKLPPFPLVWITNNVVYIVPLEEGHSKQAPTGMVSVTLAAIKAKYAA